MNDLNVPHTRSSPRLAWTSAWLIPLLAGGVGLLTFEASLGLSLVDPTNVSWLLDSGDLTVHFFGWHLFRTSPWTSPAGANPNLLWPMGTSVGLTDSIPVLAFIVKPLRALLPADFQYLGFWLLSCFVLQGVFGALLIRRTTPRLLLQFLGACLVVLSPPMLLRYGHAALTAHWLILAALWLYFAKGPVPLWGWFVLCAIAATTHPYLLYMVLMIASAAFIRSLLIDPAAWRRITAAGVLSLSVVVLALSQSGYFVVSSYHREATGFGYYSTNVLAPLIPMPLYAVEEATWWKPTAGQYEGFAYAGAGVLLLAAAAMALVCRPGFLRWPLAKGRWRYHAPLAVALTVLFLQALGPTITVGSWPALQYDPAWWGPLTIFRANGRMIWPVYYAALLATLWAVSHLRPRLAAALFAGALVAQTADVKPTLERLRHVRLKNYNNPLESAFWNVVTPHYRQIVLYPTRICATDALDFKPFALLAGRYGLGVNAGEAARVDLHDVVVYCDSLETEHRAGVVTTDSLYVMRRDLMPQFDTASRGAALCTPVDGYGVCVAKSTIARWQNEFDLAFETLPSLQELVSFYDQLDEEYRTRLQRPPHPVTGLLERRLTSLTHYLWYRRSGCDHDEASRKLLQPTRGELHVCGDPLRPVDLPSTADTRTFMSMLDASITPDRNTPPRQSHIDAEGEAVWLHTYIDHRLRNRDAYGARVEVLNAIRGRVPEQ